MMKYLFLIFLLIPSVSYAKIKIAVLDSGIKTNKISDSKLCSPVKNFTDETSDDYIGHGTNVVGIIIKEAPKDLDYCITMYKAFSIKKDNNNLNYMKALRQIAKDKPDIINISAGGGTYSEEETSIIRKLLNKGTVIVAAAGNESKDLDQDCNYFPACVDERIIVVGNGIGDKPDKTSNRGEVVDIIADGNHQEGFGISLSGTSQATARVTASVLLRFRKKLK